MGEKILCDESVMRPRSSESVLDHALQGLGNAEQKNNNCTEALPVSEVKIPPSFLRFKEIACWSKT